MHWQGRAEVAKSYARKGRTKYTEVLALTRPRERADLTFDEQDLHIHITAPLPEAQNEMKFEAFSGDDPFADTDLPVQL